ncbi:hypothetical protein [Nocardioides sp.]|uniref:hypothetical protein n=1 Tax=Nocardioides sp. TaxID=35761 RepID=UPI0035639EEA
MAIKDRSISPWGFIGVGAMVAVLFPYGASGLVAPPWAVASLLVAWLAMFVVTCLWFMPHPKRTLVMPIVAAVVWYSTITAGAVFLDWTA